MRDLAQWERTNNMTAEGDSDSDGEVNIWLIQNLLLSLIIILICISVD